MAIEETFFKLAVALAILFAGFTISQVITRILLRIYRSNHKLINIKADRRIKSARYLIATVTIVAALAYLRLDAVQQVLISTANVLPNVLTTILLLVLGFILVSFVVRVIERVLETVGFVDYANAYGKSQTVKLVLLAIQGFLYLVVIESTLTLIGLQSSALTIFIRVVIYSSAAVAALLALFGLRGIVENAVAGFYVKSINYVRQGQRLVIDEESGEVQSVSNVHTTILLDSGYLMVLPNKDLLRHRVKFERVKPEFKTLEQVKDFFIEQRPSYCGPACAQMALAIMKFPKVDQEAFAEMCNTEVGKGTHPEDLRRAIESVTHGDVLGQWISVSQIVDLKHELRSWLYDGALVIVDFKKNVVFPTVSGNKAHYALCVGMEGDDLILLDPNAETGGVYLANHQDVHRGMNTYSKLIEGKRGYLVLAKRGTTAYWRLSKGLVYADKDLYEKIGKQVEERFDRIVQKSKLIKNILPDPVRDYLNEWEERYKIGRLWRPKKD